MSETVPQQPSISQSWSYEEGKLVRTITTATKNHISWVPRETKSDDPLGDWWNAYLDGHTPSTDEARSPIRVAELFCGPGGLALGARQACLELGYKFESVIAVDHDKDALDVYKLNNASQYGSCTSASMLVSSALKRTDDDVTYRYPPEVADAELNNYLDDIDLLLAGPPCQGHSNLNNETRRVDERNGLYLTVPDLAIAAAIPIVVIENVPAVVHDSSGHDVVETTKRLLTANGYHIETGVLKADRLGWPQTRNRHFLIARHKSVGPPPMPLMDIATEFSSEPRNIMWAIGDLVDEPEDHEMNRRPKHDEKLQGYATLNWFKNNEHAHDLPMTDEEGKQLRPDSHMNEEVFNQRKSIYGRMYSDRPSPTLTTGFVTPGRGRFVHPTRVRMLTPREAARIQGFPDTYKWRIPGGAIPTLGSLTKWIGDAVPMPLGYAATLSALALGTSSH